MRRRFIQYCGNNTFVAVNNISPYGKQNRYYFRVGVVSRIAWCNNQLVEEDVLVLDARNKIEGATYSARPQTTIGHWYCGCAVLCATSPVSLVTSIAILVYPNLRSYLRLPQWPSKENYRNGHHQDNQHGEDNFLIIPLAFQRWSIQNRRFHIGGVFLVVPWWRSNRALLHGIHYSFCVIDWGGHDSMYDRWTMNKLLFDWNNMSALV